jgi:sugar phosphate permease
MLAPQKEKIMAITVCLLASLFYVYDYFIQVSPAIITDQLMRDFKTGAAGLGILSSCFFYTYAGMQIPAGILLDRFGARKLLFIAVMISGFGVFLFGLTHSLWLAGLSRAFVGFGSAFSFVGALFLASRWFAHRYFALIAGLVQFGGCLGSIVGAAPLAIAMNHLGWRVTMLAIGLLTLLMGIVFWIVIRDQPQSHVIARRGQAYSWKEFFSVLRNPQVLWISSLGFFCWVPVAVIGALWGVPYLMGVYHVSNTQAALYISIFWLSLGINSPLLGWYSDKSQLRKPIFYLCFALGIVGAILLMLAPKLPILFVGIGLACLGMLSAVQSLTFAVAKDFLPEKAFGTATGIINMAPIVGGALAQIFVGFLLEFLWQHQRAGGVPVYGVEDYQKGMTVLLVPALLGLMVTYWKLRETHCQPLGAQEKATSEKVLTPP